MIVFHSGQSGSSACGPLPRPAPGGAGVQDASRGRVRRRVQPTIPLPPRMNAQQRGAARVGRRLVGRIVEEAAGRAVEDDGVVISARFAVLMSAAAS